jgi:hypothetical protein
MWVDFLMQITFTSKHCIGISLLQLYIAIFDVSTLIQTSYKI